MRLFRIIPISMLLMTMNVIAGVAQTKTELRPAYVCGFAASFNDSTVYLTDIQAFDSVLVDSKTKFLTERESYSNQLKDYLKAAGFVNPTCITLFAFKRSDIEKKYLKLKKKYTKGGKFNIRYLTSSDFKFVAIKKTDKIFVGATQ